MRHGEISRLRLEKFGALRALCVGAGIAIAVAGMPHAVYAQKTAADARAAAMRELRIGAKLIAITGGRDQGIEHLHRVIEILPGKPAATKAIQILRARGVGASIRFDLVDRTVFKKRFGYSEEFVLNLGEEALKALSVHFPSRPEYPRSSVRLLFYDSRARYREETGSIYSTGHFRVREISEKESRLRGDVEWFFPLRAGSRNDRLLQVTSTLYHELVHFLNARHFGQVVPSVVNEGLATYYQSRHVDKRDEASGRTLRERVEEAARNGLTAIADFRDFAAFLDSGVGWGKGDAMRFRWYGLAMSIVDFIENSKLRGRKGSIAAIMKKLAAMARAARARKEGETPLRITGRGFLEELVDELYGVNLRAFHGALVEYVTKSYRRS